MKIPTSSPWSVVLPQNTGSFAPATTLLDTGVVDSCGLCVCSGPPSWKQ